MIPSLQCEHLGNPERRRECEAEGRGRREEGKRAKITDRAGQKERDEGVPLSPVVSRSGRRVSPAVVEVFLSTDS